MYLDAFGAIFLSLPPANTLHSVLLPLVFHYVLLFLEQDKQRTLKEKFAGELVLSKYFWEIGVWKISSDHLFPSGKQNIHRKQRGVNYSTADCSNRLSLPVNSAIPPSPRRDSLHSKFFPRDQFRLHHYLGKFRHVPQKSPHGARWCSFDTIFLLAETSCRCVATSLCWSVFMSTSESPASPVMSLRSGPPVTT